VTTKDNCYKQPEAYIDYLSTSNQVTIKFTEPMNMIDLSESNGLTLNISGPLSPYKFTYVAGFEDEYTLMINITMSSPMVGEDQEIYLITFDTTIFESKYGAELLTKSLKGFLYKIPIIPDMIKTIGESTNYIMSATIILLIASNLLLNQSSELLWGFLNTMQIIFFFPILQLYFPDHLAMILTYLSSCRLIIPMPPIEGFKSEVRTKIEFADKVNMEAINERYESMEYFSTSFLLNGEEVFGLVFQGLVFCIVVFAVRATIFTLQCDVSAYEKELEALESGIPSEV